MQHDSHIALRTLVAYQAEKVARPVSTRTADELLAEITRKIEEARG